MSEVDDTHVFETSETRKLRLADLDRNVLEQEVVAAIRQHRQRVESDQILYDEWVAAADDRSVPATVTRALQDQYVLRQRKTQAQQDVLIDMLNVLGYRPDVFD